jgi:hypothetical protein
MIQRHGPHTTRAITETPIAYNGKYPPESFTLESVIEMCVETKQFQQTKRLNPQNQFTYYKFGA